LVEGITFGADFDFLIKQSLCQVGIKPVCLNYLFSKVYFLEGGGRPERDCQFEGKASIC
jgi:hypothetical protein